jgi:hypothetical protein
VELERLAKDGNSGDFGCPSVYLAEDGTFVVQGNVLDGATAGNLENLLPGEAGVAIAPEVVVEAVRRYTQRG